MSRIVIAFGGNALGKTPEEQQKLIEVATKNLIPLIKEGHELIIGHGNGPQVGVINLAFEKACKDKDIPYMPFPECTAMSQGYIGYHIQKALRKVLAEAKINKKIATIITEVTVDGKDPSFKNPTKPVGPFYNKETATKLAQATGEIYVEDAGRGYRKVVASPKPVEILELETIKDLINTGHIVIAGGGGGIPIFSQNKNKGATAVIDKDMLCSLMATKINADILVILTNVKQAELYYNTPDAQKIGKVSIDEVEKYINDGHFAKGSMLPKMIAACDFIRNGGKKAIITDLNNLNNALKGKTATIIEKM